MIGRLKQLAPVASLISAVKRTAPARALYRATAGTYEDDFARKYRTNAWKGSVSRSGPGSEPIQTRAIASGLEGLITDLGIKTLLDIPCGDFCWMNTVDLSGVDYTGADIVDEMLEDNRRQYPGRGFEKIDLLKDSLPNADLILCRDAIIHFSDEDLATSLDAIARSGSTWLLATTYRETTRNTPIATGQRRLLNMELAPVSLPPADRYIMEDTDPGVLSGKAMGLWRLELVASKLLRH